MQPLPPSTFVLKSYSALVFGIAWLALGGAILLILCGVPTRPELDDFRSIAPYVLWCVAIALSALVAGSLLQCVASIAHNVYMIAEQEKRDTVEDQTEDKKD